MYKYMCLYSSNHSIVILATLQVKYKHCFNQIECSSSTIGVMLVYKDLLMYIPAYGPIYCTLNWKRIVQSLLWLYNSHTCYCIVTIVVKLLLF